MLEPHGTGRELWDPGPEERKNHMGPDVGVWETEDGSASDDPHDDHMEVLRNLRHESDP